MSVEPSPNSAVTGTNESELVSFQSDEGLLRLSRAPVKHDFAVLANFFEPQGNRVFCGPTSATIILNAIFKCRGGLPEDTSRLRDDDFKHLPEGFQLSLKRYSQEELVTTSPKTRSQIMGEPIVDNGEKRQEFGFQLRQLDTLLRLRKLHTQMVVVGDSVTDHEVRSGLLNGLQQRDEYVIANYSRQTLGQPGGGHFSPVGAYDIHSDSFLVMDVNPTSADWVWVPTTLLAAAMRTRDIHENRGFIRVRANDMPTASQ